ncbi:MAG: PP2C family serine/threonine-protein phosphatase [Phototrophicaceae bacterium]
MSFFRRMFNNTPEDETSQDGEQIETLATNTSNDAEDPAANLVTDKLATDKLGVPSTEELTPIVDIQEAMDQTLPVDEFDDATIPDIKPDFATAMSDDAADTKIPTITRPLPDADQFLTTGKGHLAYGLASDQGMVRMNNQDAAFSFYFTSDSVDDFPDFGVFIVADGMGGHQEGEKASAITARTLATELLNRVYAPLLKGVDMNDPDQPTIVEVMVDSVQKANEAVRKSVADGGTTLTAVVVRGEAAHIAHVGDSRAYWISDNQSIDKITRDHSVVERLIELGQITREESEYHEQRNVLYRAIGQNEDVEVEIHRKRLVSNSALLICSDGLWNMVNDNDILEIVKNSQDPQDACSKLIALANAHGGTDNITAILIKTPTK